MSRSMRAYSLSHLRDSDLLRALAAVLARERSATADVLAHLAEVDARRLYVPAGYPSMRLYCVSELGLSEQAALKRIHAARAARRFPAIFRMVADGRLHLSAVGLLAPHLTEGNARELLAAASRRTKAEVEEMLARRFPRTEAFAWVEDLPVGAPPAGPGGEAEPEPCSEGGLESDEGSSPDRAHAAACTPPGEAPELSPGRVETPVQKSGRTPGAPRDSALKPVGDGRFVVQVTIGKETCERLRYAQELLGHQLQPGDLAGVLDRALVVLVAHLEKRKFAATSKPRPRREGSGARRREISCAGRGEGSGTRRRERSSRTPRHVPAHVKRTVWHRDGGRCTFVSETGARCPAQAMLEFDHVEPVARGGRATVDGIRLRCRAHNQYEAERVFGVELMRAKREQRRRSATPPGVRSTGSPAPQLSPGSVGPGSAGRSGREAKSDGVDENAPQRSRGRAGVADPHAADLATCLRALGFRAAEVRTALGAGDASPGATLEDRVRAALRHLGPKARVRPAVQPDVSPAAPVVSPAAPAASPAAPAVSPTPAGAIHSGP